MFSLLDWNQHAIEAREGEMICIREVPNPISFLFGARSSVTVRIRNLLIACRASQLQGRVKSDQENIFCSVRFLVKIKRAR